MFISPTLMCVEWLSAEKKKKKKRTVIAPHLKAAGKVTVPQGSPYTHSNTREDNYSGKDRETQSPPCSPYGASLIEMDIAANYAVKP